ncbi:MAG: PD40 domain-containing protein [Deltaproteobacteria bacterium]|nr:PD40 domain-containing protein [Deltaproteobacteria bacterium]
MERINKHIPWIFLIAIAVLISCSCGIISERMSLDEDIYLCEGSFSLQSNDEIRKTVSLVFSELNSKQQYPQIDIFKPFDGTIFPRDTAAPVISWERNYPGVVTWLVVIRFIDSRYALYLLTDKPTWTPDKNTWDIIKAQSLERPASITISGLSGTKRLSVLATGRITITTSKDEMAVPIFYQHMPLPFATAKENPKLSVWRLGLVSSYEEPPVVMKNLPVCGNCHCISRDGTLLGMDMDVNKDKGAYVVKQVKESMIVNRDDFISWNDFQESDGIKSMGLFSRISPDGKFIVSTVKEKSFFTMIPDIEFSQFFFPIRGLIACYSLEEDRFFSLPGADNPCFVQTCPVWSPDGKYVVFARAKTDRRLEEIVGDKGYITINSGERISDLNKKYQIHFDLYRVPFNNGKGGIPEPLAGASNNGKSNYFPRYSPDGKWIVFTQSPTGLAIQPQSKLVIIPSSGGAARIMTCNLDIMNSWHSWSPDSRWIVFASKANSAYTELFITHVDESGNDSPPVLLSRFNSPVRASMVPEIVNVRPDTMKSITLSGDSISWKD